ncbi:putative TIR domain, winged helix-turn-helix DNA-binding domain-containing protein [Rosa chinensis]|uniref:ADP-ribosyl cyclase/cyclic ADP-ribose hydrolase n=1 Tax=Rosa chinensis TaxID=74649 RepID=A0A2P6R639_ROSCH|nr:disease resistance-like protein DSC1 isoform X2 [Rosa chinensis]PRQ41891.1 putative TIR domain, winged helix-turn-helix DNA-binding domain-containing protein [Rosa chinensis]
MASSSVIPTKEKYDVFISFRGQDTRKTFTSHLETALIRRKVETYIDYRLERGDEVGPALLKAIEESKISLIIFSEGYASSAWCLDELAHILECREKHGRYVIPIFYDIEPSQVRYQTGSYETAFAQHEQWLKDDKTDKVAKWKEALVKAANLSGSHSASRTARDDSDLVEQVVRDVLTKLNRESSTDLTGLIGVEGRMQKILLELDIIPEDVRVRSVVIWGMGGIGKTTLADAVYHGLSSQFEAHCFLANVRERSGTKGAFSPELYLLRNELLGELLGDRNLAIHPRTIGDVYKERLRSTKVLVVLDDVNDSSQLTFLAGEVPFGRGSRIIITTRDKRLVKVLEETLLVKKVADHDVKIYEAEKLDEDESLQLFHLNAPTYSTESSVSSEEVVDHDVEMYELEESFKSHQLYHSNAPRYSVESYLFSKKVIDRAAGIPLAINILRSLYLKSKGPEQFWDKLKKFPNEGLQSVLLCSFEGIEENEREIFLDIACFHKGEKLCDAKRILAACGLFPDDGIESLIYMSLISIKDDRIWMHDEIQVMGWKIVHKECATDPGQRSRLYTFEDVCDVLERRKKGTPAVQCISLKMVNNEEVLLSPKAFKKMYNLRFLELGSVDINLDDNTDLECLPDALRFISWPRCPLKSLPSNFSPKNLVDIHMPWSKLQRLWNKRQNPKNLRRIDLCRSLELTEIPDLSKCINIESINLKGCRSLVEITSDFGNLTKLTYLNLRGCSKLRKIPELPCTMEFLDLNETVLEELPSSIWSMEKLLELSLHRFKCNIPNVPWNLMSLTSLILTGTGIEQLPSSIGNIVGLKTLDLTWCKSLEFVPDDIYKLHLLEHFLLPHCWQLKKLPLSSTSLCKLICLDLDDCKLLEEIPDGLICSTSLKRLNLRGNGMIVTIPETIKLASGLWYLSIKNCKRLQSIPELPSHLNELNADGCTALKTVSRTEQKQCLDERLESEKHTYCGCVNLDDNARSSIMADAQIRIRRRAASDPGPDYYGRTPLACIRMCPGNEIPRWFSCQTQGSSINIKLPQNWSYNFLAFAFCVVVTIPKSSYLKNLCKSILTTNNGERHRLEFNFDTFWVGVLGAENSDHILVWYRRIPKPEDRQRATEASFDFPAAQCATEASFDFPIELYHLKGRAFNDPSNRIEVKRCGVCFLYPQWQDDDALKFEVINPQQVTTTRKRGRSEDEASGSQMSGHFDRGSQTYCEY